ncbi:putative RNA methyltransferase [Streptosporangium soli]|nr:methyltransferase domain-containing protein [Streptosporangium sp. KLBMP 9127]
MLGDVVDLLVCPVCGNGLVLGSGVVRCAGGHGFDVARQGYVSLLVGSRAPGTADTAAMVAARQEFLGRGHYAPLAVRLAEVVRGGPSGVVLDAGAGTGYYLAEAVTGRGIALDVSKHAIRRAARAHDRIGAVVADVWRPLPVRDASVDVVINVFAPRNGPEFARVLRPGGRLVVVTPTPRHLEPLVAELGLLTVDEEKDRRVTESLRGLFAETGSRTLEFPMELGPADVEAVVGMGPSAWHSDLAAIRGRIGDLVTVTASFRMSTFEPIV